MLKNLLVNSSSAFKLILSIIIVQCAGIVGSFFTAPAISTWYAGLIRPSFNPPSWIFGPVWTTLYVLIGISLWLVWKNTVASSETKRRAYFIFYVQLVLNTLWSIIFFGLHSIGGALLEIILLWIAIILNIYFFSKISRAAAWLLVPYLLWVSFASYLTYSLWVLN